MRRIERTTQFKRDYKRQKKGRYKDELEGSLVEIIDLLVFETTFLLAALTIH
jgi:mRNA interferase YafQ